MVNPSAMFSAELHASTIAAFMAARMADEARLRLVTEADAAFILSLRLDPARNQNLSASSADLGAQRAWIRDYEARYGAGSEAYFVIEVGGVGEGLLRLYDYRLAERSFCWGSWILRPKCPAATSYRSAILVYDLAFASLGFVRARFSVRQANHSVRRFHERMGANLVEENELDRFYNYELSDYLVERQRLERFTQGRPFDVSLVRI